MLVLAYHAIVDLRGAPVAGRYSVPPDRFRRQLDLLLRLGFRFVTGDEFLRFLHGKLDLPRRAILLTFDDCYEDLLHTALPILEERSIPVVAFAVSGRVGATNRWDEELGAPRLRLLDRAGLHELARRGVEIGAHSRTHPHLPELSDDELTVEVGKAVTDLESVGLPRPRLFAYPYGESEQSVERAAQAAGVQAAFTTTPDRARPGSDPYRVPRILVTRGDIGLRFLLKIILAGPAMVLLRSSIRRLRRGNGVARLGAARP